MKRDDVISKIHTYFGKDLLTLAQDTDTYLANGIQILGKEDVKTIVVGVSATVELFKKAEELHADMVLAKHPLSLDIPEQLPTPSLQKRLQTIFKNNWTVGGYHYILDIHPEVGNVPLAFHALGITRKQQFFNGWGYVGEFDTPKDIHVLKKDLEKLFSRPVFLVDGGKKTIQRIGMVSGGGIPNTERLREMLVLGLDAYITGEISEWTVHLFKESDISYFACGHHATEVLGPQAFAQKLQEILGDDVRVEFVNIWNEI